MKHSDLKVGMKVKRVSCFCNFLYTSTEGNVVTVKKILGHSFAVEEDNGNDYYWGSPIL